MVTGAVIALVMTGCGSGGAPVPTVSPLAVAPSPTPTPSPTAEVLAPPEEPAAMERTDAEGAEAAAAYFMELSQYAFLSGDLAKWEEISADDCQYCDNIAGAVEEVYDGGGRFIGGALTVESAEFFGVEETLGIYGVAISYSAEEGQVLDATGAVTETAPAESGTLLFEVIPTQLGWRLMTGAPGEEASG